MIALVRIALSRPYTFVVLALLLLIIGPLAALRTPTDIFPDIRIPVIGVVWQYTGLPPDQMSGRITTPFQRALTTTVNDIEHIVANSYNGVGIVKIFFQPNVDIRTANAQVTAISQTLIKSMHSRRHAAVDLNCNASTVPIIQVALSGEGLTGADLADIGINQLRTPLVTVARRRHFHCSSAASNARFRSISIRPRYRLAVCPDGMSPIRSPRKTQITPVGTQKIGGFEYNIQLNNSPLRMEELGDLPIKAVNGAMVYVRDVASVRDGNPPQTNIVHVDGNRSVLMMVLKAGAISTLDIIAGIKDKVIAVKDQLPDALKLGFIGDQSVFVRGAISGVANEGVIAALLTSVMILLFLGSWRSTVIIAVSIPLSVLGAIIMLSAIGETLNIMTLGGLALAVGILVDDATVTIEEYRLSSGAGQAGRAIDSRWRQPDRDPGLRLTAVHLHRVRTDVLPQRRRALPVRADGGGGDVRDDMVVHPVAHPGADDGELSPTAACASCRGRGTAAHAQSAGPLSARLRSQIRKPARRLSRPVVDGAGTATAFRRGISGFRRCLVPAGAVSRPEFLSRGRCRQHSDARPYPGRHSRGGDRQPACRCAEGDPEDVPPHEIDTLADNIGMPISGINMTYNNTGVIRRSAGR